MLAAPQIQHPRFQHPLAPSSHSSSFHPSTSSSHHQHSSPLSYHPPPTVSVPPPRFASRTNVASGSGAVGDSGLIKKTSKLGLGWFVRKLRRNGEGGGPGGGPSSSFKVISAVGPVGGTVRGRKGGKGTWAAAPPTPANGRDQTSSTSPSSGSSNFHPPPSGPSEYGRFVAANGVALMAGRPNRSGLIINEEDDEQDSRSIATSLEPFPPSQHGRHISATLNSRTSRSNYSTSFYHHSRTSSTSSSLTSVDSLDARSADEDASLRPLPPSGPPSPSPSFPTLSFSTVNSGGAGWGRSSAGGASTNQTSLVTSVDSQGTGGTGLGFVFGGAMAHIATVPVAAIPPPAPTPGASMSFTPHHQHQRSWTSTHLASLLPNAPSSPNAVAGPSTYSSVSQQRRDSSSHYSIASTSTSPHQHQFGSPIYRQHSNTSRRPPSPLPPSLQLAASPFSFAPNSPPPQQSTTPPISIPLQNFSPSGLLPPSEIIHAPTHTTPHPRNNPHPSAPPPDNASLLTLASSSFFSYNGAPTGGAASIVRGGGSSIRRGAGGGGGGAESVSFSLAPSIMGRRRSFETGPGGDARSALGITPTIEGGGGGGRSIGGGDDAQASVRAVRRRGSCESGESRWSAAAPRTGRSDRDSLWTAGGGGSYLGSRISRSMMSGTGSRRSSLEIDDEDEDEDEETTPGVELEEEEKEGGFGFEEKGVKEGRSRRSLDDGSRGVSRSRSRGSERGGR